MFSFCYISGIVDNAADILVFNQVSNNRLEIEPSSVCMSQAELNDRILAMRYRSDPALMVLREIVRMHSVHHVRAHKAVSKSPLERSERKGWRT